MNTHTPAAELLGTHTHSDHAHKLLHVHPTRKHVLPERKVCRDKNISANIAVLVTVLRKLTKSSSKLTVIHVRTG